MEESFRYVTVDDGVRTEIRIIGDDVLVYTSMVDGSLLACGANQIEERFPGGGAEMMEAIFQSLVQYP